MNNEVKTDGTVVYKQSIEEFLIDLLKVLEDDRASKAESMILDYLDNMKE